MSDRLPRGISRRGLDATFDQQEVRKSNLILEARLLRDQRQDEAAADRFAEAASIEECLADNCEKARLVEKSFVHRFSAVGCWAQAGDFYHAIRLCDDLLDRADLPERLRNRVQDYSQALRQRRSEWYSDLSLDAAREG
jgi:hypothetical protein